MRKIQFGTGDNWGPKGAYKDWNLNSTTPPFFFKLCDIPPSIAILFLLIFFLVIKKTGMFPTLCTVAFLHALHVWLPLLWSDICKAFQPSYSHGSPGALSDAADGLEGQGQIQRRGPFTSEQTLKAQRSSWERSMCFLLKVSEIHLFPKGTSPAKIPVSVGGIFHRYVLSSSIWWRFC